MILQLSSSTKGHFTEPKHTKRPENIIPIFQPPHSPERWSDGKILGVSQKQTPMGKLQNPSSTAAKIS
jgi:hypothetical protein